MARKKVKEVEQVKEVEKIEVEQIIEENEPIIDVNNDAISDLHSDISQSNIQATESENVEQVGTTFENDTTETEILETEQPPVKKPKKPRTKKPVQEQLNDDEFSQLEAEMSEANKNISAVIPEKKRKKEKDFAGFLTGYLVLFVADSFLPLIVSFAVKKFMKFEVPSKKLKLTSEQWKRIEPIADEMVKTLTVKLSPSMAFIIMMSLSYFENAVTYVSLNSTK